MPFFSINPHNFSVKYAQISEIRHFKRKLGFLRENFYTQTGAVDFIYETFENWQSFSEECKSTELERTNPLIFFYKLPELQYQIGPIFRNCEKFENLKKLVKTRNANNFSQLNRWAFVSECWICIRKRVRLRYFSELSKILNLFKFDKKRESTENLRTNLVLFFYKPTQPQCQICANCWDPIFFQCFKCLKI